MSPALMVDPVKRCEQCQTLMVRRRHPIGELERPDRFRARRFCSRECVNHARTGAQPPHHREDEHWQIAIPDTPTRRTLPLIAVDLVIPCRDDPVLFDADWTNVGAPLHKALVDQAIELCRGCPALGPCTMYARETPGLHGVIAGRYRPWPPSSANHRVPS